MRTAAFPIVSHAFSVAPEAQRASTECSRFRSRASCFCLLHRRDFCSMLRLAAAPVAIVGYSPHSPRAAAWPRPSAAARAPAPTRVRASGCLAARSRCPSTGDKPSPAGAAGAAPLETARTAGAPPSAPARHSATGAAGSRCWPRRPPAAGSSPPRGRASAACCMLACTLLTRSPSMCPSAPPAATGAGGCAEHFTDPDHQGGGLGRGCWAKHGRKRDTLPA